MSDNSSHVSKSTGEVGILGELVVIFLLCLAWFAYCIYSEFRGSPFERRRARKHAQKEAEKRAKDYPLHWAIEHGRLREVESLMMSGASLNTRDERGQTPLHTAVDHNRPEEVKFLLKAGVDPNARESPGSLIKQEYNTEPAKLNEWGPAALHSAVWHTRNLDITTALLDAGADPNMRAHFDRTPLHSAVPPYETHETRETQKAIVRALVKAGANLEARNETHMWTPLHEAAQQSATATKALLEAGANVEARCYDGSTPLHLAVSPQLMYSTPNLAAAKVLLEGGANANARDKRNRTPLHQAATDRIILHRLLEPLLEAGANLEARDNQGHTPLHLAAADWDISTVEALIKAGAEVEARDKEGRTPIHHAAARCFTSAFVALVKAGADPDARDFYGKTPGRLAHDGLFAGGGEILR